MKTSMEKTITAGAEYFPAEVRDAIRKGTGRPVPEIPTKIMSEFSLIESFMTKEDTPKIIKKNEAWRNIRIVIKYPNGLKYIQNNLDSAEDAFVSDMLYLLDRFELRSKILLKFISNNDLSGIKQVRPSVEFLDAKKLKNLCYNFIKGIKPNTKAETLGEFFGSQENWEKISSNTVMSLPLIADKIAAGNINTIKVLGEQIVEAINWGYKGNALLSFMNPSQDYQAYLHETHDQMASIIAMLSKRSLRILNSTIASKNNFKLYETIATQMILYGN